MQNLNIRITRSKIHRDRLFSSIKPIKNRQDDERNTIRKKTGKQPDKLAPLLPLGSFDNYSDLISLLFL